MNKQAPTNASIGVLVFALLAFPLGGWGCSSGGGNHSSASGGKTGSAGSAPTGSGGVSGQGGAAGGGGTLGTLVGNVLVDLIEEPAHTSLLAVIFDGPKPPQIPLALDQQDGDCRLFVPTIVACDPACTVGAACTGTNQCTPNPSTQNVGVVHVQGLGASDLNIDPVGPSFAYQPTETLPFPPCAEGADVRVQADPFTLAGKCIAPLVLSGPDPIPVRAGQVVALTWAAPGRAGISRVRVALDISHHGGLKGEIDCDVPDTGSFAIPAGLVARLVSLGLAGYPTVGISRVSTATAPTQPNVKLTVSSFIERAVDTGVISCGIDATPCPDATTCQADRTCR